MDDQEPMTEQVRQAILSMPMARSLGLEFLRVDPGEVELTLPIQDGWCFRPGQLQATAVFAAADFAAVGAAGTLLLPGWVNATCDSTLKLIAPARGTHLIARGIVVKPGRLITVCSSDVFVVRAGSETHCATFLGTARNIGPSTE
jgi:acyl-coenzyme A thioesterase PaaI-like protein